MTIDNDDILTDAPLKERAQSLATIASYESKIRILLQDYDSGDSDTDDALIEEEELQEELESLRCSLLEELKSQFSQVERDAPSKAYEGIVYSLLRDRLRRNLGYFSAIQRAEEEARRMNSLIGDNVFSINVPEVTKLLSSLDEVYFIRQLCTGLGLVGDMDEIVSYQIAREFKPRSK